MKSWTVLSERIDYPHMTIGRLFNTFMLHGKKQHVGAPPLQSVCIAYLYRFDLLRTPTDFPHVSTVDQMNDEYWMPKGTLVFTNTG